MDMKLRGMYMARQLSFQGVGFSIREIPLSDNFKSMYNRAVKLVSVSTPIVALEICPNAVVITKPIISSEKFHFKMKIYLLSFR